MVGAVGAEGDTAGDLGALRSLPSPPKPTAIVLPATDGTIPTARAETTSDPAETKAWQRPYVSPLLNLESDEDRAAWFHFCHGHHVEFIYWGVTVHACRQLIATLEGGDRESAVRWLDRLGALIRGSGAMLFFCGALDAETYDRCLRPAMEAERDDFSGDMSRDFLAMMDAKAAVVEALEANGDQTLTDKFHKDERAWYAHHGKVVVALHRGKSLLREKVERLEAEADSFDYSAYVATVVRSEQALDDYDDYFGVERSDSITLDDYWTQALEKLATVHTGFVMDPKPRAELMRGDAVVMAILSDLLAE
jgi:hypothetical protein